MDLTFENMLPEDTCPMCGKKFLRMGRRSEWGWRYTGHMNQVVLLCSGECSKAYAHKRFMQDVRNVMKTKAYQVYRMNVEDHIPVKRAAQKIGLSSYDSSIALLKTNHWRELEYLEAHGWTV